MTNEFKKVILTAPEGETTIIINGASGGGLCYMKDKALD